MLRRTQVRVVGYPHKGLTCEDAGLRTELSRAKEPPVPFLLTSR